MSGWTKGPWDIAVGGLVLRGGERHGSSGPYTPFRAGAVTISVSGAAAGTPSGYSPIVSVNYSDRPGDRGLANAHLIAAAPDLAEALGDAPVLSKYHGHHGFEVERFIADYEAWRTRARAALAKARGETP